MIFYCKSSSLIIAFAVASLELFSKKPKEYV
jgi:hypothetical protein